MKVLCKKSQVEQSFSSRLDLVNIVVIPHLFTELSLFTKSSLDKEKNMKKGAGVYSLNRGSLDRVSDVPVIF